MKSIMISIQPQWVSKILNKEKLVEIIKTKPKCELPCKVYIYRTKGKKLYKCVSNFDEDLLNGKVVAEFTLNKVDTLERDLNDWLPKNRYDVSNELLKNINLNQNELWNYGQGKTLYAWYIDDLKIYDKPKELSEFSHYIPNNKCPKKECGIDCEDCMSYDSEHETCLDLYYLYRQIKIPPQSWCYVEEIENE